MLTLRTTLEPNGHLELPPGIQSDRPMQVLITFLEEPIVVRKPGTAASSLALLRSPTFQQLPKSATPEIEHRIAQMREEWETK